MMSTYSAWRASVLLGSAQKRATAIGDRVLRELLGDLEAELSELLDPRCGDGAARASDAARQSRREWRGS